MVINHNDVNKNSFHQGPPPMSSNLLQYLWDCWDSVCGGATVRLRERPALDVMYSISSSPSRLHWSKEGSLSAGGGCVWWYCCFRLEHNAKQIGGKKIPLQQGQGYFFLEIRYVLDQMRKLQSKREATVRALPILDFSSCHKQCESKEAFRRQTTGDFGIVANDTLQSIRARCR